MMGRFNVCPGDGDDEWLVCDNAVNGHRGRCSTQAEANALAAGLELQWCMHFHGANTARAKLLVETM